MLAIDAASEVEQGDNILLKNLVPLNALSEESLAQILSRIRIEKALPGQYLFREGDTDHQNLYLLEGKIALLSGDKEVDTISSGSNIARFALAHQWPRKFSARALVAVRFVRIDSRQLSELLVRTQTQSYRVEELESDEDDDWMSQVLRSRLFQQIPAASIQNVLRRMSEVGVGRGQVVIKAGDFGDYYYVIIRGTCVVTRDEGGKTLELARLSPGDSFGEAALVSGETRDSSVTMLSDGVLARLGKADFVELIQRPLTQRVDYGAAKKRADGGALWIDVRAPHVYEQGHLPGAMNLPLDIIRLQSSALDTEREYLVYGDHQHKGSVGAFLLRSRGLDVLALDQDMASLPPGTLVQGDAPAGIEHGGASQPVPVGEEVAAQVAPVARSAPPGAPEDGPRQRPGIEADEAMARQFQERFQKALYQRVVEVRQARQALADSQQENAGLRKAQEQLEKMLHAREEENNNLLLENQSLAKERDGLTALVSKLNRELDEINEVLQDASAEESTRQWEKVRLEERIKRLESLLQEQQRINQVLRQESDETLRRLESLRSAQVREKADKAVKN